MGSSVGLNMTFSKSHYNSLREYVDTGTVYIVADSFNQAMRSRHWAMCGLMTRFSLYRWDSC